MRIIRRIAVVLIIITTVTILFAIAMRTESDTTTFAILTACGGIAKC